MKKKLKMKYDLTFLHKFVCVGLLLLGAFLFIQPKAFHKDFQYGSEGLGVPYLEKGAYELEIYHNAAGAENEIIVYTDAMTNDANQPGVELYRTRVGENGGKIYTLLELEQDTRSVYLKTSRDTPEQYYISRVILHSVQLQNKDNYFLAMLCMLGAVLILFLGWYVPREKYQVPILLVVLGLAASMPLFSDFIMDGHDLGFHVARIQAVYEGIRAGAFPVYLGTNQMGGFGMLSATMYPDLFLYPVAILRFFGVSLMLCYKMLLICMHIGSAFTSYYAAEKMCRSPRIGFWASVFYTFATYRLTNTYFRASLGETLAMVFLPMVIWGIYEVLWGNYKKWYLLALGVGGILQSHVLSAEMCVFFLVIEVIVWFVSRKWDQPGMRMLAGVKAAGMTILVNAFFLVPFLFFCGEDLQCFDMPNQLADTGVYFSQMFSLFAQVQGEDLNLGNTVGEMPHTVGVTLLLGAILLCVEAFREKEKCQELQVGKRCLGYGALALLMSSWLFPWDKVQNIAFLHDAVTSLQFAWRFMAPASALLSIAAAVGVVRFAESAEGRKWVYGVMGALVVCSTSYFFGMKGVVPCQYQNDMSFNDFGYTDSMYMYSDGESFKPHNLNYSWPDAYIRTLYGTKVAYSDYERKGTRLQVSVEAPEDIVDYLLFPFYYYPGYEILMNGEKVDVLSIESLVACVMPEGSAAVEVRYRGMPAFAVANWVSLLTVFGIAGYNIVVLIKRKKGNGLQ